MFKRKQKKYFLLTKRSFHSILLIFLGLAVIYYLSQRKIKEIECLMNGTPCSQEVKNEFGEFIGQNFFLVNPEQRLRELRFSYPEWKGIRFKKIPFNKLLVMITTRQPVAFLKVKDQTLLLDKEGVLMRKMEVNPGLPEIETDEYRQEEIEKALTVITLVRQYSLSLDRIRIEDEKMVAFLPEIEVLLPLENLSFKIASLQAIILRAKIEGRSPKKIDLRFEKPIITL